MLSLQHGAPLERNTQLIGRSL